MTSVEILISRALATCSFLPASWDKHFCRDMAAIATNNQDHELSEYQNANLLRLVYKYRRQLPTGIVELALDEMERNADRRSREGRAALAEFSKPISPRKKKARAAKATKTPTGPLSLFDE